MKDVSAAGEFFFFNLLTAQTYSSSAVCGRVRRIFPRYTPRGSLAARVRVVNKPRITACEEQKTSFDLHLPLCPDLTFDGLKQR